MYTRLGTEHYMAPEVFDKGKVKTGYDGFAADVYSAGVTLFVMFTGKPPFNRLDPQFKKLENKLYEDNKAFWELYQKHFGKKLILSEKFQSLVNGMLNKDPAKRL